MSDLARQTDRVPRSGADASYTAAHVFSFLVSRFTLFVAATQPPSPPPAPAPSDTQERLVNLAGSPLGVVAVQIGGQPGEFRAEIGEMDRSPRHPPLQTEPCAWRTASPGAFRLLYLR